MADKPPTAMPPASDPFPGSRTPGWNDPPTMSYNPLAATAPGRTRILNKRVAYPLQGSVTSTTPTTKPTAVVLPNQLVGGSGQGLPPPPMATMQPVAVVHPMPPMSQNSGSQQESIQLPLDALMVSFRNLRDKVPLVQESVNVRREEIERRLGIIEQLWQSGNLSEAVKQKIYNLSLAVQRNAHNEATEIYTSLVANHANECTSWAVTLRHIVLTIAPTQTPMTATANTANITIAAFTGSDSSLVGSSTGGNTTLSAIPTMTVSAMPRSATNSNEVDGNSSSNVAISRIQHI
ncbi:steroid receptor RNA activator 1 [Stomoxys calcitrans]|uniref:SRA1/Sec31 domain-containing protein n=1 Tax=Stomoxys calcitrans TaxID=35570 RepID=A0A1I8Q0P6_STOCA|nr:steroid receptor RNA activator 1 [Stomoxys calcitrans]